MFFPGFGEGEDAGVCAWDKNADIKKPPDSSVEIRWFILSSLKVINEAVKERA
jgi:hypothetical protein